MCILVHVWYKYAYGTEHPHDIWNQLHNNLEQIAVSLHTNFINSHCTDHLDFKNYAEVYSNLTLVHYIKFVCIDSERILDAFSEHLYIFKFSLNYASMHPPPSISRLLC